MRLFCYLLISLATLTVGFAVPFEDEKSSLALSKEALESSAQFALEQGVISLAETQYRKLLNTDPSNETYSLNLSWALIAQHKLQASEQILQDLNSTSSRQALHRAVIHWLSDERPQARNSLTQIDPTVLNTHEQSWYYLLNAFECALDKRHKDAQDWLFLVNEDHIQTKLMAELLFAIENKTLNESDLNKLRRQLNRIRSTPPFSLVKLWVYGNYSLGFPDRALEWIQQQLTKRIKDNEYLDLLTYYQAWLLMEQGEFPSSQLERLLTHPIESDLRKKTTQLIARYLPNFTQDFANLLAKSIEKTNDSAWLTDLQLLIVKAHILLKDRSAAEFLLTDLARFDAQPHLQQTALRYLVSLNLDSPTPPYRQIANYLIQLNQLATTAQERAQLSQQVADAFYKKKDYDEALQWYRSAWEQSTNDAHRAQVLYQQILTALHLGNTQDAQSLLDDNASNKEFQNLYRWKAEWNLIATLKDNAQFLKALDRIKYLINSLPDTSFTSEFSLRLLWLKAQLSAELNRKDDALADIKQLQTIIKQVGADSLSAQALQSLTAESLILEVYVLLAADDYPHAQQVIDFLREAYPDSSASMHSYLLEARYHSRHAVYNKAQQLLITAIETYPDSPHTPTAIYEAALNAAALKTQSSYEEAIRLLERIVTHHLTAPIAFEAMRKQADFLREINQFSTAEQRYELILKQFPNHPERPAIEMALLDCKVALAATQSSEFTVYAVQYARLFQNNSWSPEFKAQAAYKSALTYRKAKNLEAATEICWLAIDQLAQEYTNSPSSPQSLYWFSQVISLLDNIFLETDLHQDSRRLHQVADKFQLHIKHSKL